MEERKLKDERERAFEELILPPSLLMPSLLSLSHFSLQHSQ